MAHAHAKAQVLWQLTEEGQRLSGQQVVAGRQQWLQLGGGDVDHGDHFKPQVLAVGVNGSLRQEELGGIVRPTSRRERRLDGGCTSLLGGSVTLPSDWQEAPCADLAAEVSTDRRSQGRLAAAGCNWMNRHTV